MAPVLAVWETVFPHSLLSELIGNMLGLEIDEIEQEDVPDALMELLNVVCGKFLVASFGSAVKFNLAIPTVSQMDASDWETQKRKPNTTVFVVEGEPVSLNFPCRAKTERWPRLPLKYS